MEAEAALLNVLLSAFSLFVYWRIHFHRLDYSLDTSFLGFCRTDTVKNESSRVHAAYGALSGALWQIPVPWCFAGPVLLLVYSVRNFKHLRKMHRGFGELFMQTSTCTRRRGMLVLLAI